MVWWRGCSFSPSFFHSTTLTMSNSIFELTHVPSPLGNWMAPREKVLAEERQQRAIDRESERLTSLTPVANPRDPLLHDLPHITAEDDFIGVEGS